MRLSRKFSLREKVLMLILALLVVFAAYYLMVHRPVTETLERCAQETETLNTEIMILAAKKQKQDAMQAELDEIKAKGNPPIVPDYDNLDRVMSFLYDVLSSTNDYELSVQSVQREGDSAGIVRRSMTLKFTCQNYRSAKAAIRKLQESPYCCRLGAMSLSRIKTLKTQESRSVLQGAISVSINTTFFEHKTQKG